MSDEQQAAPGEEEKVIYIKIPPPGTGNRTGNLRMETALARLQTYIDDFKTDQRAVKQAAQTFREVLRVQPAECTAVIQVLQAVRQKTVSCLEFLESESEGEVAFRAHRLAAIVHLHYLDGEETARLILRLDAFRSKCRGKGRDEERINTHVQLQSDLASYVEHLQDLIAELEQLPGKVRAFEQRCRTHL